MEPVGNWKFPRADSAELPGEMFIYLKLLGGWVYVKYNFQFFVRNDDEPALILQDIWYTDFPVSNKLYQGDGVVMLK